MPYYSPYHQAMLVHYAPPSYGRSAGTSAFAAGDAVAAGTIVRGGLIKTHYPIQYITISLLFCFTFSHRKSYSKRCFTCYRQSRIVE